MKLRPWIKLSLALNALLFGFVTWLSFAKPQLDDARADEVSRPAVKRMLRVSSPATEIGAQAVEVNESFNWAQIESTDYRVYIANLRAIHCPELTVRDIITADVDELFSSRVRELVDSVTGQFWDLITHQSQFKDLVEKKGAELHAMSKERDDIFENLFGDRNPFAEEEAQSRDAMRRESWALGGDFLPADKQKQFINAKMEFERAQADIYRMTELSDADRQAKIKSLQEAHDRALRDLLTPAEFDELRLRQSDVAQNIRRHLTGLDLSDEEMRALTKIESDPKNAQADAQTSELLGAERFAALQRAADNRYLPIYNLTQRLNLSDAVAAQVYDMRVQAESAAHQLITNKSLSDEQRQAALLAISGETMQSMTTTLGQKAFSAYKTVDAGWWQQFTNSVER